MLAVPGTAYVWSSVRRSPAALAALGAVVTALVAGTVTFVTLDKTVTLSVDGKPKEVRSFAGTVGEVLESEGVKVGPRDVVAPSPSTELTDGGRISVRYARLLALTVDGKRRQLWVTARTVDEALDELGVRATGAFLSASRSRRVGRDGLALEVRTPRRLTVVADGKRKRITTTRPTVRAALAQAGVRVRGRDRVSTSLRAFPRAGQVVRVVRIDVKRRVVTESLPFATDSRSTDSLYDGETSVERDGRSGRVKLTYRVTYVDGKLKSRKLVDRTVLAQPVDRVVLVGTKERPEPEPEPEPERAPAPSSGGPAPSADRLNWAALADCESGGNPRAVNPAGYYGLYQFSIATWQGVGGSGLPSDASPAEQTARAQILYRQAGSSPWPVCGRYL